MQLQTIDLSSWCILEYYFTKASDFQCHELRDNNQSQQFLWRRQNESLALMPGAAGMPQANDSSAKDLDYHGVQS
jgi:hypothetical protein